MTKLVHGPFGPVETCRNVRDGHSLHVSHVQGLARILGKRRQRRLNGPDRLVAGSRAAGGARMGGDHLEQTYDGAGIIVAAVNPSPIAPTLGGPAGLDRIAKLV